MVRSSLTLFLLLVALPLLAKKIPGQIIYANDTQQVTFQVPLEPLSRQISLAYFSDKIAYTDSEGVKHQLRATEAEAIQFIWKEELYRWVSVPNTIKARIILDKRERIFLQLIKDGPLQLLHFHYILQDRALEITTQRLKTDVYLYKPSQEDLMFVKPLSFKKSMAAYFSDCPDLARRIGQKELKFKQLELIVEIYAESCSTR